MISKKYFLIKNEMKFVFVLNLFSSIFEIELVFDNNFGLFTKFL